MTIGVLVNLLVQVVAGAVGGNLAGTVKDLNLGPVGNSIAGARHGRHTRSRVPQVVLRMGTSAERICPPTPPPIAGKVVGRIFHAPMAPRDRPWFWTITVRAPQRPTERGYAHTRADAMAAFKAAWRHVGRGVADHA
jgi:hypothetical protein